MNQSDFIDKVLHKPWLNRSASFDALDCWGVVIMYYRHVLGIEIPIVKGYSDKSCSMIEGIQQQLANWDKVDRPTNHGVVFLAFEQDEPKHVGVMISRTQVLHARGCAELGGSVSIHALRSLQHVYKRVEFYEYKG